MVRMIRVRLQANQVIFIFATTSRPALGFVQLLVQWTLPARVFSFSVALAACLGLWFVVHFRTLSVAQTMQPSSLENA